MKSRILASCTAALAVVALAATTLAAALPAPAASAVAADEPVVKNLYPLGTCVVSGGELGSMGDPVVKVHEGREVRFCCSGCVPKFEEDSAKYLKKLDEQIIETQGMFYPLQMCMVMNEPLAEDDEASYVVVQNRLFKVCCDMCVNRIKKEPAEYMAKLDKAIVAQQREHYPLKNCLVNDGSELGSMGDPYEMIVANRLIKLCCGGCVGKIEKNPSEYIAKLDAAWKKMHEAGGGGGHGGQ